MNETIQNYFQGNYRAFYEKYLPNVKKVGGDEYKARCPFGEHKDKNPSFNFNNQTGKYFCHGCGKKGHIAHFYGKLNGLDTKRDFGKILRGIAGDFGISWEEKKSRIVKTYDYTDANGQLLFQVCRYEPKDFKQRHRDGNGRWIWNLKGIQPVLYRLPEVLKAEEVLIVEGEKDSDIVTEMGLMATTCPMGAKKWRDEYSESLKGKHIILLPDNDQEGREHMAQVGASLKGIAASLKWIDLPDLPSKGDVSDWIAAFKDKMEAAERLSIMIEGADPYEPPKRKTLEDAILESKDFRAVELPPKRILLNPWLTEQSITLIHGWRGTGKTWLALSILDSVRRGESFGPWETGASVPCLFVDGEMPMQDVRERLNGLNLSGRSDQGDPLYIYSDAYANYLGLPRANLLSEDWRSKMKRILITRGIRLWVLDNLASLASGIDENVKRDWDPINTWLLDLRFAGISTILLHHTSKGGQQRGTSAHEDNIDNSIKLNRPPDYVPEDGCRFITHFAKTRVRTRDLGLIGDTEFQLTEDETGNLTWTWGNVKKEMRKEVLKMFDEGATNQVIADALNITKGYVSRIRKTAIEEGLLSKKGKLTPTGFSEIYGE